MTDGRPLAARLLDAAEWFNTALLGRLADEGWPRLSRNQALLFAVLDPAGTTPAELARRLGITRQSTHTLLRDLMQERLVRAVPHPQDRRSHLVCLTARGERLAATAWARLADVERELARRIGEERVAVLRDAVSADWGPVVASTHWEG